MQKDKGVLIMSFLDVLLWIIVISCGSLYIQFNIWWVIDTYFNRKEKHIRNILNALANVLEKIEKKKEK